MRRALAIPLAEAAARLDSAKTALFAGARMRVRPGLDDKILTSWNALAIAGLARAARALDEPPVGGSRRARPPTRCDARSWRDGRLLATRKGERAHLNAYLDDYAFLLRALLELMQTRFRVEDYAWARELADVLLDEFEDPEHGGFFFTSHDHERLFHRTKPGHDNATPSGNGVAARALIVLGHLCAVPRYVEAGERAVRLFSPAMARCTRRVFASMLAALADLTEPPTSSFWRDTATHASRGSAHSSARSVRRCASSTSRACRCPPSWPKAPRRRPGGGVGLSWHAVPSADRRIEGGRGRNRSVKAVAMQEAGQRRAAAER